MFNKTLNTITITCATCIPSVSEYLKSNPQETIDIEISVTETGGAFVHNQVREENRQATKFVELVKHTHQ